jgi:hypothetical protein
MAFFPNHDGQQLVRVIDCFDHICGRWRARSSHRISETADCKLVDAFRGCTVTCQDRLTLKSHANPALAVKLQISVRTEASACGTNGRRVKRIVPFGVEYRRQGMCQMMIIECTIASWGNPQSRRSDATSKKSFTLFAVTNCRLSSIGCVIKVIPYNLQTSAKMNYYVVSIVRAAIVTWPHP